MDREQKLDAMAELCRRACLTDISVRLAGALTTDALVTRVASEMGAEIEGMAKTMTRKAITDVAEREILALDPAERTKLSNDVVDHVQRRMVDATRHAWTVATMLGYEPAAIQPEGIAFIAATRCIPANAGTLEDQDDDPIPSDG